MEEVKEQLGEKVEQKILASEDKRVPKLCNSVFFDKLSDGSIIMDFAFRQKLKEEDMYSDCSVLIEKIVTDKEHAKKIAEKLMALID